MMANMLEASRENSQDQTRPQCPKLNILGDRKRKEGKQGKTRKEKRKIEKEKKGNKREREREKDLCTLAVIVFNKLHKMALK